MDQIRRNFLLGAGGALGGAALTAPTTLAAGRNEVALLSTYVAGTAYYRAAEVVSSLPPGARVTLRREPRNDYDPRAIRVSTRSGAKLGYLPRSDNQGLAKLMDAGFLLTARVLEVVPDRRQPDIRLDVFLSV